MGFKNLFLFSFSVFLFACGGKDISIDLDEYLIGVKVDKISSLTNAEGDDADQIVIYDEMKQRIHQFNLNDMKHIRYLNVEKPQKKHAVVAQEKGHFIIDMYDENLAIYNKAGQVEKNPINLVGEPVSVAFRPELSLFIIYDSLNSIGVLQMDVSGNVLKSRVIPPLVNNSSILAGDLLASGNLVLSLSDGTIAVIDTAQTLDLPKGQKPVVPVQFASPVTRISWIAPIRDNPNQIFVKGETEIAIIDLVTKAKVDSMTLTGSSLEKISKSFDPHMISRSNTVSGEINLFYVQNAKIIKRTLQKQGLYLLSSQLNLTKDRWSFIETSKTSYSGYYDNSANQFKTDRLQKMFSPSDMTALKKMSVPDQAQVLLSSSSLFALFPADLGHAVRYDVMSGEAKVADGFNFR